MGLGQRLREIRYPKNPPTYERLLTKDTYKQFDTMGVVEKVMVLLDCTMRWMACRLDKLKSKIKDRDCVFYIPEDPTFQTECVYFEIESLMGEFSY